MSASKELLKHMYTTMLQIRGFESRAKQWFMEGDIFGFLHLYLGEEAIATGACSSLRKDDYITSTHRGHGHLIAKGGDLKYITAELFARTTGYNLAKGGSMHIANTDLGILGANGIVGAGLTLACGAGLSIKVRGTDQVCVCFFGDGASNHGTFHESLNLASIWKLPVIFVCENNELAVSTRQSYHMAIPDIADRASAYGIPGVAVDGNDVLAVYDAVSKAAEDARAGRGPTLIECKTYRIDGHFAGDPGLYRTKEEIAAGLDRDPLPRFRAYLLETGAFTDEQLKQMEADVDAELEAARQFALESPFPEEESALEDVYSDIVEEARVR